MSILNCPCIDNDEANLPEEVGSKYYCESVNNGSNKNALFSDDLLWDGKDCGNDEGDCCNSTYQCLWLLKCLIKLSMILRLDCVVMMNLTMMKSLISIILSCIYAKRYSTH